MSQTPPPLMRVAPPNKPGKPTWVIVLIVLGIVGFVGVFVISLLAAIAIPNFVRARKTAQMNACINNLRMIDGAKQQWALEKNKQPTDTPTQGEIVVFLRNQQFPVCPAGGIYTINAAGKDPACSIPDHRLSGGTAFPNR